MLELVKKIKELIEAYHAINETVAKEIKRIVEEWGVEVNTYAMEYIQEQIRNEVAAVRYKTKKLTTQKLYVKMIYF